MPILKRRGKLRVTELICDYCGAHWKNIVRKYKPGQNSKLVFCNRHCRDRYYFENPKS